MCLAQRHNAVTPARLESTALPSRVNHDTTEPLRSLSGLNKTTNKIKPCWAKQKAMHQAHLGIEKVLSEGVQLRQRFFFICFFELMTRERGSKTTKNWPIIGPPAKHHLNGWRAHNGPNFDCWLGSFVIFRDGGGGGPDQFC